MLNLASARELAEAICENVLGAHCERIEIAGSVRRETPEVKDIEIVCIPRTTWKVVAAEQGSLIESKPESKPVSELEVYIQREVRNQPECLVWWQMKENGVRAGDGAKYKKLQINPAVLPKGAHGEKPIVNLDLFIVTPDTWGNQFAIRTGHRYFSEAFMVRIKQIGMRHEGGVLYRGDTPMICTDEAEFFELIGWPCLKPRERTLRAAQGLLPNFTPREMREAA